MAEYFAPFPSDKGVWLTEIGVVWWWCGIKTVDAVASEYGRLKGTTVKTNDNMDTEEVSINSTIHIARNPVNSVSVHFITAAEFSEKCKRYLTSIFQPQN